MARRTKGRKFNNRITSVEVPHYGEKVFHSKKEADRAIVLADECFHGAITALVFQPSYTIEINNQKVCRYVADFSYVRDGVPVVEDVKGVRTGIYRLKAKLMKAVYGVEIYET